MVRWIKRIFAPKVTVKQAGLEVKRMHKGLSEPELKLFTRLHRKLMREIGDKVTVDEAVACGKEALKMVRAKRKQDQQAVNKKEVVDHLRARLKQLGNNLTGIDYNTNVEKEFLKLVKDMRKEVLAAHKLIGGYDTLLAEVESLAGLQARNKTNVKKSVATILRSV